jgi:hypothetical protein
VKITRVSVLVLATLSLLWHGVMLTVPHDHADPTVPQEELACSASNPSSQTNHLHGAGHMLTPHPCVACLAGSNTADVSGTVVVKGVAIAPSSGVTVSVDRRSQIFSHLPLKRGPPLAV